MELFLLIAFAIFMWAASNPKFWQVCALVVIALILGHHGGHHGCDDFY